ncbi:MAG: arginine--tRNA ligase [Gammaproteobacteria bacterium CG_4_10_14_0_8_um_filter_38_16]|nr:MAG: arginine--tRNA ligase [Gammaproteobacteria bacterium CG_4_10_14_0_8_um_filter_38_16]PJA03683.1 MAG: arginine--tRNA ligase [Gammaproteobacteria bacterium CG_4_10_14_0_2_um_filter_38_22]PJB11348.1 MAG: arginine--tRNA ligase [Gammaproteobacteria bacterium CG_4_9_14_3_um_filter_38_9]
MKETLVLLIKQSLSALSISDVSENDIQLTRTKTATHGDFATNIAMLLAKKHALNPRELAEKIIAHLPKNTDVKKVEIAGPGFINFFLSANSEHDAIKQALTLGEKYGCSNIGNNKKIHIEFVSANPTGPLHVGHGRSAAFGACVSNLLAAIGYNVHREYYVNDAGRQMRILGASIWMRYITLFDRTLTLPLNVYRGDYVIDIAKTLHKLHGEAFLLPQEKIDSLFPKIEDNADNKDIFIDQFIENLSSALGATQFEIVRKLGVDEVTADIKNDLMEFGVTYNEWFPESKLYETGWLETGIETLKKHGFTFEKEGALWFRATDLGDEKDRVLVRANGVPTYFASDVAYHTYKYDQGYDQIIDVFGADHHGYLPRIKAFLQGLGKDTLKLKILLVQFAILYRGAERVQMSTRSGEFVTLRELRKEVGNDATRFFYIMRKPEQHLDFDLELAKSTTNENPVYYIQYAHARICSVWRQLAEKKLSWHKENGLSQLNLLTLDEEKSLVATIASFPEFILSAGEQYAPHKVAHYLQTVAQHFHAYYNAHKFIVDDAATRDARLCLVSATQQTLKNGLTLLGVSAPEAM